MSSTRSENGGPRPTLCESVRDARHHVGGFSPRSSIGRSGGSRPAHVNRRATREFRRRLETHQNAFNSRFALRLQAATDTMFAWLMRGGAVWQLVGLIT